MPSEHQLLNRRLPGRGVTRTSLPAWAIDLITDGVVGATLTRHDVVKATRQVMLSAHRHEWTWPDLQPLLTDVKGRRLAAQISTGRGGRAMPPGAREKFFERHWRETSELASQRPAWSRDDVLEFIGQVQDTLDASDLPNRDRDVVQVVIDLANQHGTSRPAVPVRVVADQVGLSRSTAQRTLANLAETGHWIGLAKRGNHRTHRASLYNLAPPLAATYTGATPPMSHPVPMSHPPMSHEGAADMPAVALVITDDELEMILRAREQASAVAPGDNDSNVVYLAGRSA